MPRLWNVIGLVLDDRTRFHGKEIATGFDEQTWYFDDEKREPAFGRADQYGR